MSRVTFLRHGILQNPYNDYTQLTLMQLNELAEQKTQPHINQAQSTHLISKKIESLKSIEAIYCATNRRSAETAALLAQSLNKPFPIEATALLNEIVFSPAKMIAEAQYKLAGMDAIRESLFMSIVSGDGKAESLSDIYNRVNRIDGLIKKSRYGDVLVVTHGFLMRFLQVHYLQEQVNFMHIKAEDIAQQKNYYYLDGFTTKI